jgi:hypothetical protein
LEGEGTDASFCAFGEDGDEDDDAEYDDEDEEAVACGSCKKRMSISVVVPSMWTDSMCQ